jgi:hypothetical protein
MTDHDGPPAAAEGDVLRLLRRLARVRPDCTAPNCATQDARDAAALKRARQAAWIDCDADGTCRLSSTGREYLRRALSRGGAPGSTAGAAKVPAEPQAKPAITDDESPIAWLARRKGRDGQPLLSSAQIDAAERLRADHYFAGLTPRVTTNWSSFGAGDRRRSAPGAGVELRDSTMAARERVNRALREVGPELAGLLVDVCCHLKRLEAAEMDRGWPPRTAKIVLGLGLTRLARHYGIIAREKEEASSRPPIRHWGSADYRPTLDQWRDE